MQRAHGHSLQKSVFIKPLLTQRFPQWKRENLVNVCITFLEHLQYLHSLNVLVGDINPMNVLVDGDGTDVFIVDTDSFQVEGFPCPVGTVNFSPPGLQNKNFKSILRREEDELFAIATMLFMVLVPGKAPYSQQGGESPEENIVEANFPYPLGDDHKSKNVSPGPWRYIWSHLPYKLKKLFHTAFRENKRIAISEWLDALRAYKNDISKGYVSNEIFPAGFKVPKGQGISVKCTWNSCSKTFEMHRDKYTELTDKDQSPICPDCQRVIELERLARNSASANDRSGRRSERPTLRRGFFSNQGNAGANRNSAQARSKNYRPNSPPQGNVNHQNSNSGPGLKSVAIFLAAVVALALYLGWWVIPVILVILIILGLAGNKLPR